MKLACVIHDQVNLVLLPLLGALTLAGLTGHAAPELVTHVFLAYVLADFVWVAVLPEAVPSLPSFILLHHAVTAALLTIPLRFGGRFHTYTCLDGLVELNTFLLIARRQWRSLRRPLSIAYWASFVPLRLVLYPALVPVFLAEMRAEGAGWGQTLLCVGSQVILVAFNLLMLVLSVLNWRKRRAGGGAAKAHAGGEAAKGAASSGAATAGGAKRASVVLRARTA